MLEQDRESTRDPLPESVVSALRAIIAARGQERRLREIFEGSLVPMSLLDNERRIVDANRASRLMLRLSLEQARTKTVNDMTPPDMQEAVDEAWVTMRERGSFVGTKTAMLPDGDRVEFIYCMVHNVLPGLHLSIGMPSTWPDDELGVAALAKRTERGRPILTDREIQVLQLTADGAGLQEIAEQLTISAATAKTHLRNVHRKLGARNRAHAIVIAIENGLIETSRESRPA